VKILYDGQIYADQITGGISRYFTNIIQRLPPDTQPTLTASYRRHKNLYPQHPNLKLQEFPDFRPYRIAHALRGQYFRWRNDRQSFDVFHPTYYQLLSQIAFNRSKRPLVITVYDMIHELFADKISSDGTIERKQTAIQAADAIICISESTKNDLLKYFPAVASKIVVTYLASEFRREWADGDEPTPSQPYFLYVGSRAKAYKNFDTLVLAFAAVVSVNPDVQLCVVGAPFNETEQRQIAELQLTERIQHYQYANDTHLAKLYRCSVAFVYPSLYEGFGIPPLEAMACGAVVVAANSSSIPEVVGDAGILFDPKSVSDLADILIEVLNEPSKRERLIAKGFERYQQFNWDKTAAQTLEIYRSLSKQSRSI
jgi:glycosyltransferase involved in cell wall biosynthesis